MFAVGVTRAEDAALAEGAIIAETAICAEGAIIAEGAPFTEGAKNAEAATRAEGATRAEDAIVIKVFYIRVISGRAYLVAIFISFKIIKFLLCVFFHFAFPFNGSPQFVHSP